MTEKPKNKALEAGGNIDQVRDILFGNLMREYNDRFEKLESELSTLTTDTRDRINQTRDTILTEVRANSENLEKRLKTLDQSQQSEAENIRQEIERVNQKLLTSVQQLDDTIDTQVSGVRRDLLDSKEALQNSMRTLRTQVTEALEKQVTKLHDVKVSREDMAEMLMEMAMKLKGTGAAGELSLDLSEIIAAAQAEEANGQQT